jgi:hypothetical protein
MTEAACSSETSVDFQWPVWGYIPDDNTLHNHRCKNLKSYKGKQFHSMFRTTSMLANTITPTVPQLLSIFCYGSKIWSHRNGNGILTYTDMSQQSLITD